jgi:hypothetical protein
MLFKGTITSLPFKSWVWQDFENKRLFLFAGIAIAISFVWLKIIYPFPNFMPPDSNSYIEAADKNQLINVWAIGYSKFLRLVSSFSSSHFVLVMIQYLLLIMSVLYLLFSIRYLLSPSLWTFRLLFALSVINPLLPHISNFVSTDALFTMLSLVWFTQLLWIIRKPTTSLIICHAFILLVAFMVRFNALYYPFISVLVLILTKLPLKVKLVSIALIISPVCIFIGRTQYEYFKKTKTIQYSAFGGWQIAANALYGYANLNPDPVDSVPSEYRKLHLIVNNHMDSLRHLMVRPDKEVAVYYLWDFKSPLRVYMNEKKSRKDTATDFFIRWASMAPLYSSYGKYLIKNHPTAFLKHYVWPNTIKYYAPPVNFMGIYNMGSKKVAPVVVKWFGWKDNKLPTLNKERLIKIVEPFSMIIPIINIIFVLCFASFYMLVGFSESINYSKNILWWTMVIWISNMLFSVFAAPIELRYQLFPFLVTFSFVFLLLEFVLQKVRIKTPNTDFTGSTEKSIAKTVIQ